MSCFFSHSWVWVCCFLSVTGPVDFWMVGSSEDLFGHAVASWSIHCALRHLHGKYPRNEGIRWTVPGLVVDWRVFFHEKKRRCLHDPSWFRDFWGFSEYFLMSKSEVGCAQDTLGLIYTSKDTSLKIPLPLSIWYLISACNIKQLVTPDTLTFGLGPNHARETLRKFGKDT